MQNKMTDEQRIESIKAILKQLHDPKTGFDAKREELRKQYKDYDKYRAAMEKFGRKIAETHGVKGDDVTESDIKFSFTGKDVVENRFAISCGNRAKAFCYMHDKLVKEGKIKPLDLQIMMSTSTEHLIDGMVGHTLPCVKMGDGKWYAIESNVNIVKNLPDHPKYPGVPFVVDDIEVGKEIHHILNGIEETPYKVMNMMRWKEYEKKMSKFPNFLKASVERGYKATMITAKIELVLKNMKSTESAILNIYNFCKEMGNSRFPIKVVESSVKGDEKRKDYFVMVKLDGNWYSFSPRKRGYLSLLKLQDLGVNRFMSEDKNKYEWSMSGYMKWYEKNVMNTAQIENQVSER